MCKTYTYKLTESIPFWEMNHIVSCLVAKMGQPTPTPPQKKKLNRIRMNLEISHVYIKSWMHL